MSCAVIFENTKSKFYLTNKFRRSRGSYGRIKILIFRSIIIIIFVTNLGSKISFLIELNVVQNILIWFEKTSND